MHCAIIGGSVIRESFSASDLARLAAFGEWLAEEKLTVLTGACAGIPQLVGKACLAHGGRVIGYSPASNLDEHIHKYAHPVDGCSELVFLDAPSDNMNARFLLRSIPLLEKADIIVSLEGNWGTLFEMVTGVVCGKTLVCYQGFGGITDDMPALYKKLSDECAYDYGEAVYYVQNIDALKKIILDRTQAQKCPATQAEN